MISYYYGLAVASLYVGWPDFKMAAPINVLAFSRQYHRRGANASV